MDRQCMVATIVMTLPEGVSCETIKDWVKEAIELHGADALSGDNPLNNIRVAAISVQRVGQSI